MRDILSSWSRQEEVRGPLTADGLVFEHLIVEAIELADHRPPTGSKRLGPKLARPRCAVNGHCQIAMESQRLDPQETFLAARSSSGCP